MSASVVINASLRRAILVAAGSGRARRFMRRYGMRLGAARFVAGETLDDAVPVLKRLNEQGLATNTTLLGEHLRGGLEATEHVVVAYDEVLRRIACEGLRTNVALKLTHLGLDLDEELACRNVEYLVRTAAAVGNFIRIDMEESARVDSTLRTYRSLRDMGHENVGIVLQSYLYRSEADLRSLIDLAPNVRIVKGAYLEPAEVAYVRKADVDAAFARLMELSLRGDGFTAIATHDDRLIEHALRFTQRGGIPRERFQFQMLYGVRPQLQLELARSGYSVLVATPFGPEWYPYLMRRLGERPANLLFFLRYAFRR